MKNNIPMFSARRVNSGLNLKLSIERVLNRHWYVLGEEVAGFEREFAEYTGCEECVALANGTDALELALRAVGVKSGDRVVTVANAGFYGSAAIYMVNAVPLYVDIDERLTMQTSALPKALQQKPKAVIVPHLYGLLADIEEIVRLAKEAGVAVVEDCAQAHGAKRNGKLVGSFGDVGCFSFYPTKNLGALGDGGAIVCNNSEIVGNVRSLAQYGWSKKYHVEKAHGRNSRLDEIQAAILRDKLPLLDECNIARRHIAQTYNAAFAELPVVLPVSVGDDYVAHLFVLQVKSRDAFRQYLSERGVATDVHYPVPDYRQPAYSNEFSAREFVNTERVSASVVSLPCFPGLNDKEVDKVINAVTSYFSK